MRPELECVSYWVRVVVELYHKGLMDASGWPLSFVPVITYAELLKAVAIVNVWCGVSVS